MLTIAYEASPDIAADLAADMAADMAADKKSPAALRGFSLTGLSIFSRGRVL
jgi:hypothetical protein